MNNNSVDMEDGYVIKLFYIFVYLEIINLKRGRFECIGRGNLLLGLHFQIKVFFMLFDD